MLHAGRTLRSAARLSLCSGRQGPPPGPKGSEQCRPGRLPARRGRAHSSQSASAPQSLRRSRGLGSGRKGSKTRTARLVGADTHPEAAAGAGHPGTRDSPDPRSWSAFGRKPQI